MKSPSLAELIDLEVQLRADAELAPEELHARDGAIGSRIGATALTDRAATLAWLAEVRGPEGPGARAEQRRHQISAGLVVLGFLLGVFSVGGWLATGSREPVNVVYFWPVFVGSQIALALGFWLAVVPTEAFARVPFLGGFHSLLRTLAGAVPSLVARALARVSPARGERGSWGDSLAELRRLDWLYGKLRFWLLAQMTQLFAVAFNLGALAAFVVIPAIDDPAFGWRSRLLNERQVEAATTVIASPWSSLWPQALPSTKVIADTRYSSVAERYIGDRTKGSGEMGEQARRPWAAWWPFLVASMAIYGLAPRLLYLAISALAVRRALAGVSFDRVEIRRGVERMRWPVTQTAGVGDEASSTWPGDVEKKKAMEWPAPTRAIALRWVGIDFEDEDLARALARRFGAPAEKVHPIGDVDGECDEAALSAIDSADSNEGVYVVVESWEPPVGDQLDLLGAIRERGGATRPILVVLYGRSRDGGSAAPEPRHQAVWERSIQRRGDPGMFVAPLVLPNGGKPG